MREKDWPCKNCGKERRVFGGVEKSLSNGAYIWRDAEGVKQASFCQPCKNLKQAEERRSSLLGRQKDKSYEMTPNGYIMRVYRNMKSRVEGVQKQKHHLYRGKEILSKEDFYKWALSEESKFYHLFKVYIESGKDRRLAPSVDRIDSSKGYVLENMEWVTHSENSRRGALSRARKLS